MYIPYRAYKNFPKNAGIPDNEVWRRWSMLVNQGGKYQPSTPILCPGALVLVGAGTIEVDGVYCPDGDFNGYPMWTKTGGTSFFDSIYAITLDHQELWGITSGGSYAQNPLNVKYFALLSDGTPPPTWTQASGGLPDPPIYG